VQAHAVGRNIDYGRIQRGNVGLYHSKRCKGTSWKSMARSIARSGQSSCKINPWHESAHIPLHLLGDGKHIALMGVVVGIAHGSGNDPREAAVMKRSVNCCGWPLGVAQAEIAFLLSVMQVGILHLCHRLGRLPQARGALLPGAPHGGKIRELGDVRLTGRTQPPPNPRMRRAT
jgi:hypothetical protein